MSGVLAAVALRCLTRGTTEPIALAPGYCEALCLAISLVHATGDLSAELRPVLALARALEGRGQSPAAGRSLFAAIAGHPLAIGSLGIESGATRKLREIARSQARRAKPIQRRIAVKDLVPRDTLIP
jgi:hypothetical protein